MTEPTETKLYSGRVLVHFHESNHSYFVSVDGGAYKRKKGCSTIASVLDKSRALQGWQQLITAEYLLNLIDQEKNIGHDEILEAVAQCDLQKEEAANVGKTAHSFCEAYILHKMGKGPSPEIPEDPQVRQAFEAFLEWESGVKIEYHASEQFCYSLKNDYCGTFDLDTTINGKRAILDFKVSSGLYPSVNAQVAGYALAATEESRIEYDEHWALRLNKLTEKEHYDKEKKKAELRKFIAKMKGEAYNEYPPKNYQVFEAKLLAGNKKEIKRDKDAFLNMLKLSQWNYAVSDWK